MEKANRELLIILLREWFSEEKTIDIYDEMSIPALIEKIEGDNQKTA